MSPVVMISCVGEVPTAVETKASVQLFASTLIAGKVLTINAPVMEGGNFAKASYMVNDLMESLIIKR
ncbi:hypothetical protein A3860_38185 [Niastella vici]|uniref:Uncharacterized protein n=2 Tax=Niastella vici TaxID=1703345 RepID=A0A1V9FLJ1_9BACT|nr:hypothetical protein A3860_38185 [Niastella vici]